MAITATRAEVATTRLVYFLNVFDKFTVDEITMFTGLPKERIQRVVDRRSGNEWDDFIKMAETTIDSANARREKENAELEKQQEKETDGNV